jgi:hypothetical protein
MKKPIEKEAKQFLCGTYLPSGRDDISDLKQIYKQSRRQPEKVQELRLEYRKALFYNNWYVCPKK